MILSWHFSNQKPKSQVAQGKATKLRTEDNPHSYIPVEITSYIQTGYMHIFGIGSHVHTSYHANIRAVAYSFHPFPYNHAQVTLSHNPIDDICRVWFRFSMIWYDMVYGPRTYLGGPQIPPSTIRDMGYAYTYGDKRPPDLQFFFSHYSSPVDWTRKSYSHMHCPLPPPLPPLLLRGLPIVS